MIGIVFATPREAAPLLEQVETLWSAKQPFECHRIASSDSGTEAVVIVSGVGKVAAAVATSHLAHEHGVDEVINAGICGAVVDHVEVGQLFRVVQAQEGDAIRHGEPDPVYPSATQRFAQLPTARLITLDQPVFDRRLREQVGRFGELVDMEGAAVARTCAVLGLQSHLIKAVSDMATEGAREQLLTNIQQAAQQLARAVLEEIF